MHFKYMLISKLRVLSCLFRPVCSVLSVPSCLFCPACSVLSVPSCLFRPVCSDLSDPSCLFFPGLSVIFCLFLAILLCLLLQHLPYISLSLSSLRLSGTACFCKLTRDYRAGLFCFDIDDIIKVWSLCWS